MKMTSRERVLVAFAHEEPDRVPCWCGASPKFWEKAKRQMGLDDEGLRSGSSLGRTQYSHPHAWLTPDNRWVVFTSDRTGVSHVYSAWIPATIWQELDQ